MPLSQADLIFPKISLYGFKLVRFGIQFDWFWCVCVYMDWSLGRTDGGNFRGQIPESWGRLLKAACIVSQKIWSDQASPF